MDMSLHIATKKKDSQVREIVLWCWQVLQAVALQVAVLQLHKYHLKVKQWHKLFFFSASVLGEFFSIRCNNENWFGIEKQLWMPAHPMCFFQLLSSETVGSYECLHFSTRAREQKVQYFQDSHLAWWSCSLGGRPESIALSARARAQKSAGIHNCQLFQMIKVGKGNCFITKDLLLENCRSCTTMEKGYFSVPGLGLIQWYDMIFSENHHIISRSYIT